MARLRLEASAELVLTPVILEKTLKTVFPTVGARWTRVVGVRELEANSVVAAVWSGGGGGVVAAPLAGSGLSDVWRSSLSWVHMG